MEARRIALLNAATPANRSQTSHNFRECLTNCTIIEYHVHNNDIPTHHNFDAYIITGSGTSVLDTDDWITNLKHYLKTAINTNTPILGICFGHQLLADTLGGTVEHQGEYELGYYPITKTIDSTLLDGIESPFYSFITHEDIVTKLPENATQIASTEYGIHGFELNNVHGLQSHPEYTETDAHAIIDTKDVPADVIKRAHNSATTETVARATHTKQIFKNFLNTTTPSSSH